MASNGIRDRVAIVGMGCTPFGEHWDKGPNDLPVAAAKGGAADVAMAIGVEKLKDSGISGLPNLGAPGDGTKAGMTAPAMFSLLAPAYARKYGVDEAQLKEVMTRIAWKNHKNGALNPRAQFRKEVSKETIACSPLVAGSLGIFDCSGVSDGPARGGRGRADAPHR